MKKLLFLFMTFLLLFPKYNLFSDNKIASDNNEESAPAIKKISTKSINVNYTFDFSIDWNNLESLYSFIRSQKPQNDNLQESSLREDLFLQQENNVYITINATTKEEFKKIYKDSVYLQIEKTFLNIKPTSIILQNFPDIKKYPTINVYQVYLINPNNKKEIMSVFPYQRMFSKQVNSLFEINEELPMSQKSLIEKFSNQFKNISAVQVPAISNDKFQSLKKLAPLYYALLNKILEFKKMKTNSITQDKKNEFIQFIKNNSKNFHTLTFNKSIYSFLHFKNNNKDLFIDTQSIQFKDPKDITTLVHMPYLGIINNSKKAYIRLSDIENIL